MSSADADAPLADGQPAADAPPAPAYPQPARWRRWRARVPWRIVVASMALVLVAFALGILTGRSAQPPPGAAAAAALEQELLPLVREADSIWTGDTEDDPAVAVALASLRSTGDPQLVVDNATSWVAQYDRLLADVARVDVPPEGRPVQRQFLGGLVVSRDAVEVLVRAADAESTGARRLLIAESIRLRSRSEFLTQSARTSLNRLTDPVRGDGDQNTGVPPRLPDFDELLSPGAPGTTGP